MKTTLSPSFTYLARSASAGFIPENIGALGSYLAIFLIFLLDAMTGPAISFDILYVFPLIFIALRSSSNKLVIAAVVLSISLQIIELAFFHPQALGIQIYLLLIVAFANSTFAVVVRYSRANILEAKYLSAVDPLTQLYNRRTLVQAIDAEAMRQRRYGGHFSVALIDLDGFKGLNDSMGHQAGDDALILLANILRSHARQTDTVARVEGDEFVILMRNTRAKDCSLLCHLLCQKIGRSMSEVFSHPITASIGFTTIEPGAEASNDILSITDLALHRAKSSGKGRVVRGYARELAIKKPTIPPTEGLPC